MFCACADVHGLQMVKLQLRSREDRAMFASILAAFQRGAAGRAAGAGGGGGAGEEDGARGGEDEEMGARGGYDDDGGVMTAEEEEALWAA